MVLIYFKYLTKRIYNKGIFLKLSLSFTGSAIFSVLILGFFFAYTFSKASSADVNNMANLALTNVCMSITNTFEASNKTAYNIYNYTYVKDILMSQESDKYNLYMTSLFLNNILSTTPNISSIYLFNGKKIKLDVQRSSKEIIDRNDELKEISLIANAKPILYPLHRLIKSKKDRGNEVFTFTYNDVKSDNGNKPSVIINVSVNSIYSKIYTKYLNTNQDIILTDKKGIVLMNRDKSMISKDVSKEDFFVKANRPNIEIITFKSMYDGKNQIFHFMPFDGDKYYAFLVSDYNTFFQNITSMQKTIIAVCFFVALIVIALALYFSYNLFAPLNNIFINMRKMVELPQDKKNKLDLKYISSSINAIVEKLNNSEADMTNNFNILRHSFVKDIFLLDKCFSDKELEEGFVKYKLVKISQIKLMNFIIVFRLGDYKNFIANNLQTAIEFQLGSIENIISEVLEIDYKATVIRVNYEHIIIFISESDNKDSDSFFKILLPILRKLQSTVNQLFNIQGTLGISNSFSSFKISEIRGKYREAYNLTYYRLVYGIDSIILKDNLNIIDIKNDKMNEKLDLIVDIVKTGSLEDFKKQLKLFFLEYQFCQYDFIIGTFFQLAESIYKMSYNLNILESNSDYINLENMYNTIKKFENYSELESWFVNLYIETNDLRAKLKEKKSHIQVENVVNYIKQNYSDFNISANLMADKLSITSQHFSKIFKEYTGLSFPDFVHNIRLEKAKELILKYDSVDISQICEKIGMNNRPYFTTLFTKKYGVSPTKYKQISLNNIKDADPTKV